MEVVSFGEVLITSIYHETNNFQSLLCSFVNAQKKYSLFVLGIRDVIAQVLRRWNLY